MHQALTLLGELDDADLEWIFRAGSEQSIAAGAAIALEGVHPEALSIVLEGVFEVRIAAFGDRPLARLGPGELVGEMSFVTGEPASASIVAAEGSRVLALPRKELQSRLDEYAYFAARLYRAFAVLAARRLRERVAELGSGAPASRVAPESDATDAWGELSDALAVLKKELADADAEALRSGGAVPEATVARFRGRFAAFVALVNRLLGHESPHPAVLRDQLGRRLQQELVPYMLLAENLERSYSKPRGYAGDFLTIHRFYEDRPAGTGRIGPLIDRCYLDIPPVVAVRNRRALLAAEIDRELAAHPERPVHVTSLACGPARELFDAYARIDDPNRLRATGIDIDFQALAFVADQRDRLGLRKQIRLEQSNLVYLALGREKLELPPQDLVYSIGLIDYFEDKSVVLLLDYVHGLLAEGGRVIVGNFHPGQVARAFADYVLDWRLIYRTEEDMNRLFAASAFGRPCTRIQYEEQRINLFAECEKEAG